MAKNAKGGQFERELCKKLSLWWTNGEREDIFWRTAGSGARATTRSKSNKATAGSYGDLTNIDPIGKPLLDVFTIEAKRGYSSKTFADLMDHSESAAEQQYETWILKAIHDAIQAKSLYWLLITRRNQRRALVFMPMTFARKITAPYLEQTYSPWMEIEVTLRDKAGGIRVHIGAMDLDDWLRCVKPERIKELALSKG